MTPHWERDPRVKVKWAIEHIRNLNDRIETFLNPNPYEIVEETDLHTGEKTERFASFRDIPDHVRCLTGDIIHNLRAALDHLIYRIVPPQPVVRWSIHHGFPVAPNSDKWIATRNGRIKGFPNDLVQRFDRLEPYKRGNGHPIWQLHELNNLDKHRLLMTVTFAQHVTWHGGTIGATGGGGCIGAIDSADEIIMLEDGAILLPTEASGGKVDMNQKPRILVAFDEPTIIEPEPVVPQLLQFADLVERVIAVFDDVTW